MLFRTPKLDAREKKVLDQIRELWRTLKYRIVSRPLPWRGLLARTHLARAIRGSNSIEGYDVTRDDAMAAAEGEQPFDADPNDKSWIAVSHYRDAMTYVLRLSEDPEFEYQGGLIRGLHYMMMRHDPKRAGLWRTGPIFVRDERGPTPSTVYEGPPAGDVPKLMKELVDQLRVDEPEISPMVRAAMAHLNLIMIHPFGDGNGRLGRCLQTLVLARAGVLDPTFCSVEEYLRFVIDDYYAVCAEVGGGSWHPERSAKPWVRFMLKAHYQQAQRVIRREHEMGTVFGQVETLIAGHPFKDRALTPLVNAAFGFKLRNISYRFEADDREVSQLAASRDLKALCDHGLLEPRGQGRGRFYVASPRLLEIREGARLDKALDDPFES